SPRAAGVGGYSQFFYGVTGESDAAEGAGVFGTSGAGLGIGGYSHRGVGVYGRTDNQRSWAGLFWGPVAVLGDLTVFGANKSAAVPHPDGSHRRLYTMESPESWFEDFGSAKLTRGKATIKLDRDFAALVRTERYHVFLTPEADSNGLFVSRKNRRGFEVREQR